MSTLNMGRFLFLALFDIVFIFVFLFIGHIISPGYYQQYSFAATENTIAPVQVM